MRGNAGITRSQDGKISRRTLLSCAGANILISHTPWQGAQAQAFDLARFVRLSEKLTGHSNLPPETARHYLRSIFTQTNHNLRKRKVLTGDRRTTLNARIVADWFSGQTIGPKGIVCIDYTGALLWDAIGFAKPRGVPDAEAGRWAHAPF